MFENAEVKLRDARTALERLRSLATDPQRSNIQIISGSSGPAGDPVGTVDPVAFAEGFSSSLAQLNSMEDIILKDLEANAHSAFHPFRKAKMRQCKSDELIRFINKNRNSDLHAGNGPLVYTMYPIAFDTANLGPAPTESAILRVDGTGPYWIIHFRTPHERRVAVQSAGQVRFNVAIANPPRTHLQQPVSPNDPISVLHLAETYYANLLHEARCLLPT